MAMTKCDECGHTISDRAAACVQCGAPVNDTRSGKESKSRHVQTIQATGKRYKGQQILAAITVILGVVIGIGGGNGASAGSNNSAVSIGVALFLSGLAWFFLARFFAWWNHG